MATQCTVNTATSSILQHSSDQQLKYWTGQLLNKFNTITMLHKQTIHQTSSILPTHKYCQLSIHTTIIIAKSNTNNFNTTTTSTPTNQILTKSNTNNFNTTTTSTPTNQILKLGLHTLLAAAFRN